MTEVKGKYECKLNQTHKIDYFEIDRSHLSNFFWHWNALYTHVPVVSNIQRVLDEHTVHFIVGTVFVSIILGVSIGTTAAASPPHGNEPFAPQFHLFVHILKENAKNLP